MRATAMYSTGDVCIKIVPNLVAVNSTKYKYF